MKKVGVALSGGLDSTILAALLSTHYEVIPYTHVDEHVGDETRVNAITDYLNIQRSNFIYADKSVPTWVGYIASVRNEVEELYYGDTLLIKVDNSTSTKRLAHDEVIEVSENTICKFPFYKMTKAEVCYIGKIMIPNFNTLLDMTRSCTIPFGPVCNICFHCNERKWALEQIS